MRYMDTVIERIYNQFNHSVISLTDEQADFMFLLIKNNSPEYPFGFSFDVYDDEILITFDYIDVDNKDKGYQLYASLDNKMWKPISVLSLKVVK